MSNPFSLLFRVFCDPGELYNLAFLSFRLCFSHSPSTNYVGRLARRDARWGRRNPFPACSDPERRFKEVPSRTQTSATYRKRPKLDHKGTVASGDGMEQAIWLVPS